MQQDTALHATTRAIYDEVYPGEEWAPVGFEEAEHLATVHYRQAVSAAHVPRLLLQPVDADQLLLL